MAHGCYSGEYTIEIFAFLTIWLSLQVQQAFYGRFLHGYMSMHRSTLLWRCRKRWNMARIPGGKHMSLPAASVIPGLQGWLSLFLSSADRFFWLTSVPSTLLYVFWGCQARPVSSIFHFPPFSLSPHPSK